MKVFCYYMVTICCLGFASAWAEEQTFTSPLDKRLTLFGGVLFSRADGNVKNTVEGQSDDLIRLDDLGLDNNNTSLAVGGIINFWKRRLTLRLDYFGYHEDENKKADYSFDWDGKTIPVNADLDSNLDLDLYVINLAYNFIRSDRVTFGVGAGVHLADVDIGITGTVNGVIVASGDADVLAPLPNVYVNGAYAFTDKFLIRSGGGAMSLSSGDWDGELYFVQAFLEYWTWQHLGFGAGYRYVEVDVDYDPGDVRQTFDFTITGPVLYVTAGF